jgi:pimeloyl-ACP methyl ester carboxylesterase
MLDRRIYNFLSDADEEIFVKFLNDAIADWRFDYRVNHMETEAGKTFFLESGISNKETIIWLHGYGLNADSGKNILEGLGKKYHVIIPDIMWQIGRSIPKFPLDKKDLKGSYNKWLVEILDYLKIDRVNIIGLSFGTWIAMGFALDHADRIKKIVLISPAGISASLRLSLLFNQIRTALFPNESNIRKFVGNSYGKSNQIDDFDCDLLAMLMKHCKKNAPALVPAIVFTDGELSSIQNPLYLIVGEDDIFLDIDKLCERTSRLVKNVKISRLKNAAHYLHNTHYEVLEKSVIDFLEE